MKLKDFIIESVHTTAGRIATVEWDKETQAALDKLASLLQGSRFDKMCELADIQDVKKASKNALLHFDGLHDAISELQDEFRGLILADKN